jgi:hypothetical protein
VSERIRAAASATAFGSQGELMKAKQARGETSAERSDLVTSASRNSLVRPLPLRGRAWALFIVIAVGGAGLAILLHIIAASVTEVPQQRDYGVLGTAIGPEAVASLWALVAFFSAAFVFHLVQWSIPGDGLERGVRYGAAIGALWLVGMLEGVALFGNSIYSEFVIGLSDAIPVIIMSVLLGVVGYRTPRIAVNAKIARGRVIISSLLMIGFFVVARYTAYFSGLVDSGHREYPLETLLWTLFMAASIAAAYFLVGVYRTPGDDQYGFLRFGLIIFGANWAAFLVFIPMLFEGVLVDILLRISFDTVAVVLACYVVQRLQRRS